ncbi:MAG TPA: hypothetical protein VKA95_08535 [Nitrososphaeraceae archaeon]|nr:hypothetical protein [Nitrososphaeraceae archaeon]
MKEAGFGYARFRKGYFAKTSFFGEADFNSADFYSITFSKETTIHQTGDFSESIFHGKTTFRRVIFEGWTKFQNALFEEQEKTVFDVDKLSKVSFMNTDTTRVRFTERVNWTESQEPKIVDEILLEHSVFPLFTWESVPGNKKQESKLRNFLRNTFGLNWIKNNITLIKSPDGDTINITSNDKNILTLELKRNYGIVRVKHNDVALPAFVVKNEKSILRGNTLRVYSVSEIRVGSVQSIYRNLRENYEYRMRYDEAGKFFIREMELKRKFREVSSPDAPYKLKYNNWFRCWCTGCNCIIIYQGTVNQYFGLLFQE